MFVWESAFLKSSAYQEGGQFYDDAKHTDCDQAERNRT